MTSLAQRVLLVSHTLETLPEGVAARKRLLKAVTDVLPRGHDLRTRAAILLVQLEDHEKALRDLQRELPLLFAEHAKGSK